MPDAGGEDRLVLLGTKGGPSIRKGSPNPSSAWLHMGGRSFVIDCGSGVTRALVEAGFVLRDLETIFVTHLHSDHLLELGPLIYSAWTSGLTTPTIVYGPPGIEDYWRHFLASMATDHTLRTTDDGRPALHDLVAIETCDEGPVARCAGVSVDALRVDHPPVDTCLALRFECDGRRVVFSADTRHFPPLSDFARGADVLVHEALLEAGIDALAARMPEAPGLRGHLIAGHTMAGDAGRIAAAAGVRHLVLNHLVPADDPNFSDADWRAAVAQTFGGRVTIGRDGLAIAVARP